MFLQVGIIIILNLRCFVLVVVNSVYGRWDEIKGEENIDFMFIIFFCFDMIFIVKDEYNELRDMVSYILFCSCSFNFIDFFCIFQKLRKKLLCYYLFF